jgi:hypothetical protein
MFIAYIHTVLLTLLVGCLSLSNQTKLRKISLCFQVVDVLSMKMSLIKVAYFGRSVTIRYLRTLY